MHRLEPLVRRSIPRTKSPLHSNRTLGTKWPFFVAEQLGEVSKFGHGETVLRWPRVRTITLVIDEGRGIGVDSSTDAVLHSPGSLGSQPRAGDATGALLSSGIYMPSTHHPHGHHKISAYLNRRVPRGGNPENGAAEVPADINNVSTHGLLIVSPRVVY